MAAYVDDAEMDAERSLRDLLWRVIRVFFESGNPEDVTRTLGIQKYVKVSTPSTYQIA